MPVLMACGNGTTRSRTESNLGVRYTGTGGFSPGGLANADGTGATWSAAFDAAGQPPAVGDCPVFPPDNAWNQRVSDLPLHPRSDAFIDAIGRAAPVHPDFGTVWEGAPIGIPFVIVDATQPRISVEFGAYGHQSDPGPYPIPLDAPIEGGDNTESDRHVLAIEATSCLLYELYRAFPGASSWRADSGAVFDLRSNHERPFTWTSADAAGLPIFPGLARYEEIVELGEVRHALRFTAPRTQKAVIAPARHFASSSTDPNLPPMGLRVRMKASFDCSGYSQLARVLCTALKSYGMILADNGSSWYVSGAPDPRWDDDALGDLKQVTGAAFEVVDTGPAYSY